MAPLVQEAVTFTSGLGYAAPQTYGQETVTYSAPPVVQETVLSAAPPVQEAVTFTSGVGYAAPQTYGQETVTYAPPPVGVQETVTYAAPSVQGAMTYSAGGGVAAPQTLAYGQQTTDVNQLFNQFDANKNGVMSPDEFSKFFAVYK